MSGSSPRRPLPPTRGGARLGVAPLAVAEAPLPRRLVVAADLLALVLELELPVAEAVEQHLARGGGDARPRHGEVETQLLGEGRKDDAPEVAARLAPRENDALEDRDAGVGEGELLADFAAGAEAIALRAGAEGRVEGELTRLELGEREAALGAGGALGKQSPK